MSIFRFGDYCLDAGKRQLARGSEDIELQPKVFDTLLYLLRNADRVVSKDELLDEVWRGTVVTDNVLARAVSVLRKALDDPPQASRFIRAVPRVGYRFVGHIESADSPDAPQRGQQVLAVLPFQPLWREQRDEVLELGIADTLLSQLSNLAGLVVRPLSTVRAVVEDLQDPLLAAKRLGADACLEGNIQRQKDRVRMTVRLLSVDDQATLWSASFDEEMSDIFGLQDAICARIVSELAPQFGMPDRRHRETSADAYKAYLEGKLFAARFSPEDSTRALSLFELALDADPAYAPAWAGAADCHLYFGTMGVDTATHYPAAARASRRALALDPELPEALCVQAMIAWQYDWDWQRAERLFETAIKRYPNRADLQIAYSDYCCFLNLAEKSIEHARRALAIDPISPWVNTLLAQALHMSGSHEEAIRQCEWALELAPGFPFAHFFLSLAAHACGDTERALEQIEKAVASGRPDFLGAQGFLLGLAGKAEAAQGVFETITSAGEMVPPIARTMLLLAREEIEAARNSLRECIEKRDWHILALDSEPVIRPIFRKSGLASMLKPYGLPLA